MREWKGGLCLPLVMVACLALGACGKEPEKKEVIRASAPVPGSKENFVVPFGASPPAPQTMQGKYVAVSHSYTLRLPADAVEAVQRRHLEICIKLGCEVVESQMNRNGNRAWVTAHTSVRLPPAALASFTADLTAPPVEVTAHSETSEDKTLAVLDVDKRLETKLALRERLTTLLHQTNTKNVSDLLNVEHTLAQVQGDIESATAQRDYLRAQTEMVKIDIRYEGAQPDEPKPDGIDWRPLKNAAKDFIDILVESLANVMTFTARILPWTPVVVLAGWLARLVWRRWRRKAA
ncbi:DUF4349 domain-containing protein [Nitrospirillum sp. BR 11828]|uniref:DUF4349 domain-containing protein n=1 Tax=Nitrospirillum sp. BR 11828 TaxID=3104325 RepID=UPI002ACADB7D|nr:DUF4349 domain-containing protein [Nitrospirillum sp. BR 11828]MDZ5649067.1 DUF4349 domain-containing protein [Nitrospirillum sp. BR 11828]